MMVNYGLLRCYVVHNGGPSTLIRPDLKRDFPSNSENIFTVKITYEKKVFCELEVILQSVC